VLSFRIVAGFIKISFMVCNLSLQGDTDVTPGEAGHTFQTEAQAQDAWA
jgi:hypothetical protein